PAGGETRFQPYAEGWLATRLVKGRPLSPATMQGYGGLLRRNIYPAFADAPLRMITPEAVREWHADLAAHAGRDQAAKSYRLLRAILNTAVEDLRIGRNPCRIRGGGIERPAERPMIDAGMVLDLADAIVPRLHALVLLAGFGGLRTGEMLGLVHRDVDIVRSEVHIRTAALEIGGIGRLVVGPKSEAGIRTVVLPRIVTEALRDHLTQLVAPGDDAVLFTAAGGGPLRRAELSDRWRDAADAVGAPAGLHVHDLRHHAATLMARMPGVTTKELMARIGHSSPRAALIYQHATEERDRAIADYLDAQIARAVR
ncbi:MAG: tyrosine-type recombinase/integrase, partial [Acidimicrobiales bacterium]